ncbi:E3 ubiquitin-protein ligase TRIM35-like isoform X1 [Onychostoma macrolepis]|uniref:E3 ubiquitin-protein ligase TRIM35-like isoform X1 n=2 Tax=Onychostoma macrolepis TaxID=369639 RepID=UPI00272ABF4D|nr:E3 ubiquitin-protein ligase TRIM35-like isoform X1 [Onychostoma macrolepis]
MALEDELSCTMCTEFFRDPVLLGCGHSFCRQCISLHWAVSSFRRCSICQQVSPQQPVSNLSLRNTCESYLSEKSTRTESSGDQECSKHGEVIKLFCQTDGKAICVTCKKQEHNGHKTQLLQQAVKQRKGKLKAEIRPAEKTLWSLQNGTALDNKISKYIQTQSQMTEKNIRKEFEKLHKFLRQEEESRISALNEEKREKGDKIEGRIQDGILSLSDRVKEVEEQIEEDDIIFLKNYDSILTRAKYTLPDAELSSNTLIDGSKYLGNLKYHVWEKMKDICPYYPVILNPNTSLPDFSVSDDLTSVTSCLFQQDKRNPFPQHRNSVVLGNVGYTDGTHTWEIEVGNSQYWSLGVCLGSVKTSDVCTLTPAKGFWGIRRVGSSFELMSAQISRLKTKGNPEVIRVKLDYRCDEKGGRYWYVRFFDAGNNYLIAEFNAVPGLKLFPFMIPEDSSAPLRVVPANIMLTVEQKLPFLERHSVIFMICLCFVTALTFLILAWLIERHNR